MKILKKCKVKKNEKLRNKILILFSDYWCLMNMWKINDVREDVWGIKIVHDKL